MNYNPSLTFHSPFFLLSSTLRFSIAALCTTNVSWFWFHGKPPWCGSTRHRAASSDWIYVETCSAYRGQRYHLPAKFLCTTIQFRRMPLLIYRQLVLQTPKNSWKTFYGIKLGLNFFARNSGSESASVLSPRMSSAKTSFWGAHDRGFVLFWMSQTR